MLFQISILDRTSTRHMLRVRNLSRAKIDSTPNLLETSTPSTIVPLHHPFSAHDCNQRLWQVVRLPWPLLLLGLHSLIQILLRDLIVLIIQEEQSGDNLKLLNKTKTTSFKTKKHSCFKNKTPTIQQIELQISTPSQTLPMLLLFSEIPPTPLFHNGQPGWHPSPCYILNKSIRRFRGWKVIEENTSRATMFWSCRKIKVFIARRFHVLIRYLIGVSHGRRREMSIACLFQMGVKINDVLIDEVIGCEIGSAAEPSRGFSIVGGGFYEEYSYIGSECLCFIVW